MRFGRICRSAVRRLRIAGHHTIVRSGSNESLKSRSETNDIRCSLCQSRHGTRRARGQPEIAPEATAIGELTIEDLGPQDGCDLRPNA
jgi:hypothetical protein